ncbi:hypothetical protein SDJN02_18060, partial [Cucurbita argyrosperma subsp. argyrosperma]
GISPANMVVHVQGLRLTENHGATDRNLVFRMRTKTTKSTVKKGKSKADAKAANDPSASAAASNELDAALSDDDPSFDVGTYAHTHAAVGVVVRLLVKDIPVLIAIDQNDKWFTFSEYEEPVTVRSTPPIRC